MGAYRRGELSVEFWVDCATCDKTLQEDRHEGSHWLPDEEGWKKVSGLWTCPGCQQKAEEEHGN